MNRQLSRDDRDDRQDVTEILLRYATGIDRRDWALFRSCFTDDCQADYGEVGTWQGADAITAWMEAAHRHSGHTLHRISNEVIEPAGNGATARSYVDALITTPDGRVVHAVGFYDDELVRTHDGWKIAQS